MKTVEAFTDGGCRGNPGLGGWGAVLRFGTHEKELKGSESETTNNRMELMAAISALTALSARIFSMLKAPISDRVADVRIAALHEDQSFSVKSSAADTGLIDTSISGIAAPSIADNQRALGATSDLSFTENPFHNS